MGLFGGDDGSPDTDRTNALLEEQMRQNQFEIAQKRQDLYEQKIEALRAQGGQTWVADRTPKTPMGVNNNPGGGGVQMPSGLQWQWPPFGRGQ